MTAGHDPLWKPFVPIWNALRAVDPHALLTGGYALFLKQRWLLAQAETGVVRQIVPFAQWRDYAPRVTKDMDLLTSMEMIASPDAQGRLNDVLSQQAWNPSERHARWQFVREEKDGTTSKLEFHAQQQEPLPSGIRHSSPRIKPKPPLHLGIHGHENPEAVVCHLNPFRFCFDGIEIAVPNPITMSIMKVTAVYDQRTESVVPGLSPRDRNFHDLQARKHAQDVFRNVAMTTREESDSIKTVLEAVRQTFAWQNASTIVRDFFFEPNAFGIVAVESFWEPSALGVMTSALKTWFAND